MDATALNTKIPEQIISESAKFGPGTFIAIFAIFILAVVAVCVIKVISDKQSSGKSSPRGDNGNGGDHKSQPTGECQKAHIHMSERLSTIVGELRELKERSGGIEDVRVSLERMVNVLESLSTDVANCERSLQESTNALTYIEQLARDMRTINDNVDKIARSIRSIDEEIDTIKRKVKSGG